MKMRQISLYTDFPVYILIFRVEVSALRNFQKWKFRKFEKSRGSLVDRDSYIFSTQALVQINKIKEEILNFMN